MKDKSKTVLCRGCGTSYIKWLGISGRYCSEGCKVRYPRSRTKCKPICHERHLEIRHVVFKNQARHTQQVCRYCRTVKYLPLGSEKVEQFDTVFKLESKRLEDRYDKSFYTSAAWRRLRYQVFVKYGKLCQLCGTSSGQFHVDHIKPRSRNPELELNIRNLQVLCEDCNIGKSNHDDTDWRKQ